MNCIPSQGKLALLRRLTGKSSSELFHLTIQAQNNPRERSGQPWHSGLWNPMSWVMTAPYFPLHLPSEGIRASCSCTPPDATPFTNPQSNHWDVWQLNSERIQGTQTLQQGFCCLFDQHHLESLPEFHLWGWNDDYLKIRTLLKLVKSNSGHAAESKPQEQHCSNPTFLTRHSKHLREELLNQKEQFHFLCNSLRLLISSLAR